MRGSCLCGDVKWEYSGTPQFMGACHCSMCRKAHGSAFATAIGADPDGYRVISGKDSIATYRSSPGLGRPFCARCGSPVAPDNPDAEFMILQAGCLDDDPGIRLSANIFAASKAPWHEITESVARFDAYPPGLPNPVIENRDLDPPEPGVVRGSCLCGGAAFELRGELPHIVNCHCSRCRKAHGAAHASILRVAPDQLTWVRGRDLRQTYEPPEAVAFRHSFCSTCGSSLPQDHLDHGIVGVHAGLLDDDPGVRAGEHIWVGSKAPWFEIADDLPQFEEYPPTG